VQRPANRSGILLPMLMADVDQMDVPGGRWLPKPAETGGFDTRRFSAKREPFGLHGRFSLSAARRAESL
jgi:hypothetical protein